MPDPANLQCIIKIERDGTVLRYGTKHCLPSNFSGLQIITKNKMIDQFFRHLALFLASLLEFIRIVKR
jgi:hypothetical protein